MPECRLLPYADADGPHNMAADEALLESAAAGIASLRFYGWTTATLTLGYFQPSAAHRTAGLGELPWVRRPTGGAALVHHHELTYALALPAGPPWQHRYEAWIRQMHIVVQSALASVGIAARLCTKAEERKLGEVLCFLHQAPDDLLIGNAKMAGSAQRKHRGALLQHGGILLAASPVTPQLPGIGEMAGRTISADELRPSILESLVRHHGWQLIASDWSEHERRGIEELVTEKFTAVRWNEKR
jgi:lipoate-protein ligase A